MTINEGHHLKIEIDVSLHYDMHWPPYRNQLDLNVVKFRAEIAEDY